MLEIVHKTVGQKFSFDILTGTGHSLGDRPYIISKFGQQYIGLKGEYRKLVEKDDFDRKSVITYPVTGGKYVIDFSNGAPRISFSDQA